jgi:flagellar biosynthesis protein FlhA
LNLLTLAQGGLQNLLERLGALRRNISSELGIPIPSIAVRDNASLLPHHYRLLLRGHEIAGSELFPGQLLAMGVENPQHPLRGRSTKEPTFGLPAVWISETDRREAERLGFAVVDPLTVLTTHVSETLKRNAADLLSRQDVQRLLDRLKESQGAVLQEMNTLQVGLGTLHRVLQNILREGVSVRDLSLIIEKVCDQIPYTKNYDELSEACRKALRLEITRQREMKDGKVFAITLHPEIEQQLAKCVRQTPQEVAMVLDQQLAKHLHQQFSLGIKEMIQAGVSPLLICSPVIRLGLKRFFGDTFPNLEICAYNEISPRIPLHPLFAVPPALAVSS